MFIGHFAVGFASKRWARNTPLGLLLLAPVFLDVLWPLFCLLGLERFRIQAAVNPFLRFDFISYPWSHSLVTSVIWGVLLGLLWRFRGGARHEAIILGGGVVSHWVLDWITHVPDLPVWPGGTTVGLGLWHSMPGTMATELLMLGAGGWLYLRSTRAKDKIGIAGPWVFLALLVASYFQSVYGSPPPTGAERLVAMVAVALVLLFPLASWIDGHRTGRGAAP